MTGCNQTNDTKGDSQGFVGGRQGEFFARFAFLWVLLLFCLTAFVIHRPGFRAEMVYDSAYFINSKAALFAQHEPLKVMSIVPSRPLFLLTFYLNYLVSGMDTYGFRLVNDLILALSAGMIVLLAVMVFDMPGLRIPGTWAEKRLVAVFLGLFFLVHPLQSYVVLYIWQREAGMACLFYCAGLLLYLATRSGRVRRTAVGFAGTGVLFLAGLLSKENVITFPVALVIAEATILRQGPRDLAKRAGVIFAGTAAVLAAYFSAVHGVHGGLSEVTKGPLDRLLEHYTYAGITPWEVVLTQCRIAFTYVRMVLIPYDVEFMRPEFISRSLLDPPVTLAACAGVAGLFGLGLWATRRRPLLSFGILFSMTSLLPESLLIPQYLFFSYRAILPMVGVLLIAGEALLALMSWLRETYPQRRMSYAAALLMLAAVVGVAGVTRSRAESWGPLSFWKEPADRLPAYSKRMEPVPYLDISMNYLAGLAQSQKFPEVLDLFNRVIGFSTPLETEEQAKEAIAKFSNTFEGQSMRIAAGLIGLGVALSSSGRFPGAVEAYRRALEAEPHHTDVRLSLGSLLEARGDVEEAIGQYEKALEIDPGSVMAYHCLGAALKGRGRIREAAEKFWFATQVDPQSVVSYLNLGAVLQEYGNLPDATAEYEKALQADPNSPDAHHKIGRAFAESGDAERAIKHYRTAAGLNPYSPIIWCDLGLALEYSGRREEALHEYQKAVQADPGSYLAHYLLALALKKSGRLTEAVECYRRAIEIAPAFAAAHNNMGTALEQLGRLSEAAESYRRAIDLEPLSAASHNNLGVVLKKRGELSSAMEQYRRAMELDPNFAPAYTNMARALEQAGDMAGAAAYYRIAFPNGTQRGSTGAVPDRREDGAE